MAEDNETMVDDTKGASNDAASSKKKKGLLLGGGTVGLVAAGYILSLAAVPSMQDERSFDGPFLVPLSTEQIQVNLSGEGGKRFLVMSLTAEYLAYDEPYAMSRVTDILYNAKLKDALIAVSRQKSKADLDDAIGEDVFKEELREAVNPLLFPVHIGNEVDPTMGHDDSGLQPGDSIGKATMRGPIARHVLVVDATRKILQLDEGPETSFEGRETDLAVQDAGGSFVYVDVTELDPEYTGSVPVGVLGRVRSIYFEKFLVQ